MPTGSQSRVIGHQTESGATFRDKSPSICTSDSKHHSPICHLSYQLARRGKEERRPVSHTFTDKDGEFVFGPLCKDREYEVQIWVDRVKHVKVCAKCEREGKCLKGEKLECKKFEKDHMHQIMHRSEDESLVSDQSIVSSEDSSQN